MTTDRIDYCTFTGWIDEPDDVQPLLADDLTCQVAGQIGDNVYYSIACNGHGLAQAPYTGSLIADLIVDRQRHHDLDILWKQTPRSPRPLMTSQLGLSTVWVVDRFNDRINGSRRNARRAAAPTN